MARRPVDELIDASIQALEGLRVVVHETIEKSEALTEIARQKECDERDPD